VPENKTLKGEILKEAHESRFATHLGSTKMYRDSGSITGGQI